MISAMGDLKGKGKGGFVLLDENFKVRASVLSHPNNMWCATLIFDG